MVELVKPASMTWEDKVSAEAMQFVSAVQQNFQHALNVSLEYLPDQKKPEYRATQIDFFFDAVVGLTAQIFATYANPSEDMEEIVIHQLRAKFKYIRKKQAEHEAAKMGN